MTVAAAGGGGRGEKKGFIIQLSDDPRYNISIGQTKSI